MIILKSGPEGPGFSLGGPGWVHSRMKVLSGDYSQVEFKGCPRLAS